ncbi:MAG: PDDEXK nuclease domain-containing protein, partial [Cetobacterium sp.]
MLERKDNLYHDIKALLENARKKVLSTVNSTMTLTYFLIGKKIVEEEQNGELRAEYGKELIKNLATKLTKEFGKGFTVRNLELIRKFYMTYSEDEKTKSVISFSENPFKLSWTHYIRLVRIQNVEERSFYEIEAEKENWTVREMDRQISSCLYERLVLSRDKEEVKALSTKGQIIEKPKDIIKDPYVLEFLGLEEISSYSENTLETSIINHIEKFIMELGK